MDKSQIQELLYQYDIKKYTIMDDLRVHALQTVIMCRKGLETLPINFYQVDGDFDCSENQLTSLKGCPEIVTGSFWARNNKLTSTEGCHVK